MQEDNIEKNEEGVESADDSQAVEALAATEVTSDELAAEELAAIEQYEPSLKESVFSFLFVTPKLISLNELVQLTKHSQEEVEEVMTQLISEIEEAELGIEIKTIGESYQLRTRPHLAKVVQRMITPKMKRLSKAAAETLAIVAYKQPVSKAEIEAIRGVDALPTLKTLLDGKLIRIVGREDTPGSPALYGTSDFFLERFGLKDLSQLPTVREIKELDAEASEIPSEDLDMDNDDADGGEVYGDQGEVEVQLESCDSEIQNNDSTEDEVTESASQDDSIISAEEFENLDPENTTNH